MSDPAGEITVLAVEARVAQPLRMSVLRPGASPGQAMHEREHAPETVHIAAMRGGEVLSVASVMPDPHPRRPAPGDWRLRGMATRAQERRTGLGGLVLAECERLARAAGAARLWCNARTPAVSFYRRGGLEVEGEEFNVPGIGPHFLMSKLLR